MQIKKEEKRERIIKGAINLFARYGFQEVSVLNIAKEVNIGKGTIYTYFKTKDDILEACVAYIFNGFVIDMETAAKNSKNMATFLDKLIDLSFINMLTRSRIFFLFHRRYYGKKSKYRELTSDYKKSLAAVYNFFKEEIECPLEEMSLYISGFMMTSYMINDRMEKNRLKTSIKRALKLLILKS